MSTATTAGAGHAVRLIGTCEAARILVAPRLAGGMLRTSRRSTIGVAEHQILVRVDRGGILIGEGELRYQLELKERPPLAREDELLDVLAEIEARGLVEAARLVEPDANGKAGQ